MSTQLINIEGSIAIYNFYINLNAPVISTDYQNLVIGYTAVCNPSILADITEYVYSLDNGETWSTMTLTGDSVITNLSFTPTGSSLSFKWEIKNDLNGDIYNKHIKIKIKASSMDIQTSETVYNIYLNKQVQDLSKAAKTDTFPEDYKGVDGTNLLKNAPKAQ